MIVQVLRRRLVRIEGGVLTFSVKGDVMGGGVNYTDVNSSQFHRHCIYSNVFEKLSNLKINITYRGGCWTYADVIR